MNYNYKTSGTCASKINFDINDGKIYNIEFTGGCNGNLKAIAKLCEGRDASEVAKILAGNTCGIKNTSCADQLSKAIMEAISSS